MDSGTTAPVIIQPDSTDSAIILMHGLGADGNDFVPIAQMLELSSTKFVFPNAPVRPVTLNGGMPMRAWFDMTSIDVSDATGRRNVGGDTDQMLEAIESVHALANAEISAGIPSEHIVFAGFSQGGVIALLAGLTWDKPCAGILALSTYFPEELLRDKWPQQPAVYMAHGQHDEVIPLASGQYSHGILKDSGVDIQFHAYPMGHEVILDEIEAFKAWLHSRLVSE